MIKVEYLSNHWLDLTQILSWSWGNQTKLSKLKMKKTFIGDNLNKLELIFIGEMPSNT